MIDGLFRKVPGGFQSDRGFHPAPAGPHGPMTEFQEYKAVLLRSINEGRCGQECTAMATPSGHIYLSSYDGCFCTDAKAGIDFKFI